MYNPIQQNKQYVLDSTDKLMDELSKNNGYRQLVHKWKSGGIRVVHDDIETFTDNFEIIHMAFTNHLERNAMMYVMIHELTHIHLNSAAHDFRFRMELNKLHTIAIRIGICTEVRGADIYAGRTIDSYS